MPRRHLALVVLAAGLTAAAMAVVLDAPTPGVSARSAATESATAAFSPVEATAVRLHGEDRRDSNQQRASKHRSNAFAVLIASLAIPLGGRSRAPRAASQHAARVSSRWRWCSRAPPPVQLLTV